MREAASFIASQEARMAKSLLASIAELLFVQVSTWRMRRQLARLDDLDDRLLDDIGLERNDVRWALEQPMSVAIGAELRRRAHRRAWLNRR